MEVHLRRLKTYLVLAALATAFSLPAMGGPTAAVVPTDKAAGMQNLALDTGKTSASPLDFMESQPTPMPQTPPQTVEGVLASYDPGAAVIEVRTKAGPVVRVGLPANAPVIGGADTTDRSVLTPGKSVFVTVVNGGGVRALRVVAQSPTNPIVNYIGIPVLLVVALLIRRYDRRAAAAVQAAAA